jgi:hypothetical protein
MEADAVLTPDTCAEPTGGANRFRDRMVFGDLSRFAERLRTNREERDGKMGNGVG